MRDLAKVWGRAGIPLKVGPAVHHTPALNSMGQSGVPALYCLLHSHQGVKRKEGDKSQWSQSNLNGKKHNKNEGFWNSRFLLELI